MAGRKRRHQDSDEGEVEEDEGRISSGEEDEEEGEVDNHREKRKKGKKSKKHKKDKRQHKSKKRRRRSESAGDNANDTDKEGGSTPEVEAGEVLEVSDEDDGRRRSRSPIRSSSQREVGRSFRDAPPPKRSSRSRTRSPSSRGKSPAKQRERSPSPSLKRKPIKRSPSPIESKGGASSESLSVEETNRLRESLGLPPLKINKPKQEDEAAAEEDDGLEGKLIPNSTVRHKPAESLTVKSLTEKMRERLQQRKMKRQQENKLLTVSTLGEDEDVDDTAKWLERQKKKEKEKKKAEKTAKMFDELDDQFGVGDIVKEDRNREKAKSYDSKNLAGLTVEHDASKFHEGRTVILTLKDSDVLDEEAGDTLVNVNMMDDEKVDKNKENIKKAKAAYNPYDQEEIDQETGELRRKNMLDKYDEELDGQKKKAFTIGNQGSYSEEKEREMARAKIREKLANKNLVSLALPEMRVASDYYTEEEAVKFKKPKKKKKVKRKMLKADDLLGLEDNSNVKKEPSDEGNKRSAIPMDIDDDDEVKPNLIDDNEFASIKIEIEDQDLEFALKKAQRLKQRKQNQQDRASAFLEENGLTLKDEPVDEVTTGAEFINTFADDKPTSHIIMNETSEFCRHLGAWRSHEGTGLGESVSKDILDFEKSLGSSSHASSKKKKKKSRSDSSDSDSDSDYSSRKDKRRFKNSFAAESKKNNDKEVILDEEPDLQSGVAAAIKLAANKGYWDTEAKAIGASKLKDLEAKNYTIDDKASEDRHSRRGDRGGHGGPTQSFSEKKDYKPNVKLEYIDDDGRMLNQKEAFRYLSHKFHGKGSGKLKTEKRMKKVMEESLMKNMSSTDTPLQTLEKLRERQKEAATPYVILTGNKVQATDLRK